MTGVRRSTIAAIGVAQTLAWASTYYLPALLADAMAGAASVSQTAVFAVFSGALLLAAALGPGVGRRIDRRGGRRVLMLSNVLFAAGLGLLAATRGPLVLILAWVVLGVAMAAGLYDAAFAALAGAYGSGARRAISGVALIGGLASTVGWPATAVLTARLGWRGACLVWALLHLVVALPLNARLPHIRVPRNDPPRRAAGTEAEIDPAPAYATVVVAFVFAAAWFVAGAMAAHLPRLLRIAGASSSAAVAAAALIGPAQSAARLVEFVLMRHTHPLVSARIATALHPIGAGLLFVAGAPAAAGFALLHGAGNGLVTIARGTVPLVLFGPVGYGRRTGLIGAPARAAQAAAPLAFGLLLDRLGTAVLGISAGLCLVAFAALFTLRIRPPRELFIEH